MKTNFLQHSRGRKRRIWFFITGSIAVLLSFSFSSGIGSVSTHLAAPIYSVRTWFLHSEAAVPVFFRSRVTLEEELATLRESIQQHTYDNVRLAALEEENTLLRGLATDTQPSRIVADVVLRPGDTPYDTLLVDKGSDDGVLEQALVYGEHSVALGLVVRVFETSALVELFSTPGVVSPVYIYGPNVFARAVGVGGGVIRAEVPQGITIALGDPVVVPVTGGGVYGVIDSIESYPSNPAQYAFIGAKTTLSAVRFVTIGRSPIQTVSRADAQVAIDAVRALQTTSTTTTGVFDEILTDIDALASSTPQ